MEYTPKMAVFIPTKIIFEIWESSGFGDIWRKNHFQVPNLIISSIIYCCISPRYISPFPQRHSWWHQRGMMRMGPPSSTKKVYGWHPRRDAVVTWWGIARHLYQSNRKKGFWSGWWWLEHDWIMTFHRLGMSSSQLTFIFFRGVQTTNQWYTWSYPMGIPMNDRMGIASASLRLTAVSLAVWRFTRCRNHQRCLKRCDASPPILGLNLQGLVNVPFWEYWTSPYSSHYRPYT